MAQIFPQWTNKTPVIIIMLAFVSLVAIVGFFWYFGSPKYTDVGYRPKQPVDYSHKLHAGDLGIDCRYCHWAVEESRFSNIPSTQTCMNCHQLILPESEKLLPVRESFGTDTAIEWVRVHMLPDYAYFDHSAHVNAGVACQSCHGNVAQMDVVTQVEPLSMGWCLDCHRNPAPSIRPLDQVTNMNWSPPENQLELAHQFIQEHNINPPVDCSGCHR